MPTETTYSNHKYESFAFIIGAEHKEIIDPPPILLKHVVKGGNRYV